MKRITIFLAILFLTLQIYSQHFPVVVNDTAYTICQVPVAINVLQNDYDLEGDSIQICGCYGSYPWGTKYYSDSSIVFTPYNNTGEAILTYQVCKTNLPDYEGEGKLIVYIDENTDIPVATDDYATTMVLDTIEIKPLMNDHDPYGETFKIFDVDDEISFYQWFEFNDSIIWYSPRHNEGNVDTLLYEIIQTKEDGLYSQKSEIVIQVNPNPVLPVANPDTITTFDQVHTMVFPLLNDISPSGEEIFLKYVQHSNAQLEKTDSSILYYFEPDYPANYGYSFTYRTAYNNKPYLYSSNSSVFIELLDNPYKPIALVDTVYTIEQASELIYPLINDSDPNNLPIQLKDVSYWGTVVNDTTIAYKSRETGVEKLTYSIIQSEGDTLISDLSEIVIKVEENPDLPVAIDDSITAFGGDSILIPVLKNDFDPNGKALKIRDVYKPFAGNQLAFNDSLIIYTPKLSYTGNIKITYSIMHQDSFYYSRDASVFITLLKNPVLPIANDDYFEIMPGIEYHLNLLENDFDPIGDSLKLYYDQWYFDPANDSSIKLLVDLDLLESFRMNNQRTWTYFVQKKNDPEAFSSAKVTLKLFDNPEFPVAINDYCQTTGGIPVRIDVLENDINPEGFPLEVEIARRSYNTHVFNEDTAVVLVPQNNFYGTDTIYYTCRESNSFQHSAFGKIILDVEGVESYRELSTNNIIAGFNSYGYDFCNINFRPYEVSRKYIPRFEAPKGSGLNGIFCSTFWMGGYDEFGILHLGAEMYNSNGEDYWAGPVLPEYDSSEYEIKWRKVWNVKRTQIEDHQENWQSVHYSPSLEIANWPSGINYLNLNGKGYAPFNDADKNGIYGPAFGDYPQIKGDEALFYIFNDDRHEHTESDGERIGVEIHAMPYAFDCPDDSAFENTIFVDYKIINQSKSTYTDFIIGKSVDFDLGDPWDDYIGCDTNLNLFFVYNGDNFDGEFEYYDTIQFGYGFSPPATGVMILNRNLYVFNRSNYSYPSYGNWWFPENYYNIISGYRKFGDPITYGGPGYDGLIPTTFLFPDDPSDNSGWSEPTGWTEPGNRRVAGSICPFTFHPGDTIELELAYIFARDYEGDNISSVTLLKERAQTIQEYYDLGISPCGSPWTVPSKEQDDLTELQLFPNPARTDVVILYEPVSDNADLKVYDITGKQVLNGKLDSNIKHQISIQNLSSGLYIFIVQDGTNTFTKKLVKQPN